MYTDIVQAIMMKQYEGEYSNIISCYRKLW